MASAKLHPICDSITMQGTGPNRLHYKIDTQTELQCHLFTKVTNTVKSAREDGSTKMRNIP